jgi:type II secretory pathway component PulM
MRVTGRERLFLFVGGGSLAIILFSLLILAPAYERGQELKRLIPQKERDLRDLRALRKEFEQLKQARIALTARIPAAERALPPLSRLDGWIERSGLRTNIRSIKPSSPGPEGMNVEVVMEKTELPQLTRFLYEMQSSPGGFQISRMSIKPRYTTPRYLDVSLQIFFYRG